MAEGGTVSRAAAVHYLEVGCAGGKRKKIFLSRNVVIVHTLYNTVAGTGKGGGGVSDKVSLL